MDNASVNDKKICTLNCNGKLLVIDKPAVMGIINITPDSFYAKSRKRTEDEILATVSEMMAEGAAILDVGGQSTRPGSARLSAGEEDSRILPAIELIYKNFPEAIISADTYHASVAKNVIKAGASIINDISGGMMDDEMLSTVGKFPVPYICMHIQGRPETMQVNPAYEDVVQEVLDFFIFQTERCRQHNIKDVVIDPGFGFGKTIRHNLQLLKNLSVFKMLDKPVLVGLSRKGTVYKTLNVTAEEALNGTTALNMIALLNGASILRVHDAKEAAEVIKLLEAYNTA
ncbi:dihydropteroate synthase [Parafilimonas sp.]|uniref:dihydropteroate synthase n=1 Tax=Parafilimonas sp. TaxID=1969739 RepID=UPI0039E3E568